MEQFVEKFANSGFIKGLQKMSGKLAGSPAFSALSGGMGATMGLIMIGAVVQIICAIGNLVAGWTAGNPIYDTIYLPYKLTMGMLGLFMTFSLSSAYAKNLKQHQMQSSFTALVCFILVVAPPVSATTTAGATIDALSLNALGSGGIFCAIIISLISVRITKFVIDHHWAIKLPDSVPEGVMNAFNSIIPAAVNIIFWYGLSLAVSAATGGTMTLANLITKALAIPMSYLISPVGMLVIVALGQLFWFFGIHGQSIVFTAIMVPYMTAYATNAALYEAGQPTVFNAVFLFGAAAVLGGGGNTLPLVFMGLKSKSKHISAICKASLGPGLFCINEPMCFGFPMMYNPIMMIPYVMAPVVVGIFMYAGYSLGLMSFPRVLILSCLPVGLGTFLQTMDIRNVLFVALMFPVCWLLYYPFFKVYEKQCIANEQAAEAAEAAQQ